MGLYSLACAALNTGAQEYIDTLFTDFHRTAEESRLAHFALFFKTEAGFKILLNKGFNAETVRKSLSTGDFWQGTIRDSRWHFVRGDALSPFYQLFSAQDLAFDCLSIKKASQADKPFIFAASGEFSETYLEKQLDTLLPFISRSYRVLDSFGKPGSLISHTDPLFLQRAKTYFSSEAAAVYILKLNKLFESLFALLGPSDFDFISSCIAGAASSFGTGKTLCSTVDEESALYILIRESESADFCAHMQNAFSKMFSQKRAALMHTEPSRTDSPLYKRLSQEIALTNECS
ncbi:hypothetical protein V1L52_07805 [Treponema sp. HNW]|uniref:hypothetical protein n=1 Tax=Treponema sp. HNW TaxID=3116654 RepID=UPI003D09ADBC